MVKNEKELAYAIMRHDYCIELNDNLVGAVSKIIEPSEVVWKSILAVFVASAFFWGNGVALGIVVGLPAVLAVCGGVGGVVFITLGAEGTLLAMRLLIAAKNIEVLEELHNNYTVEENSLIRN